MGRRLFFGPCDGRMPHRRKALSDHSQTGHRLPTSISQSGDDLGPSATIRLALHSQEPFTSGNSRRRRARSRVEHDVTEERLAFGLLGPLLIRDATGEHTIRSTHQRVLVAALLLRAGRMVATEELVEQLWEGGTPSRPRQALQNHVMRVRQLLGPVAAERLRTLPSGYVLDVNPGELDVQSFTTLREKGRAAAAVEDWDGARALLDAALELWRGEPLADIPSQALQSEHCEPLRQAHLQVRELRIDADLQLARYTEAADELRSLTAAHPWRERLQGRLMLALYGSGRQAESLAVFRDFRTAVTEELGIDPDSELQVLHQRILAQEPVRSLLDHGIDGFNTRQTSKVSSRPTESARLDTETVEPQVGQTIAPPDSGARRHRRLSIRVRIIWGATVAAAAAAGLLCGAAFLSRAAPPPIVTQEVEDPLPAVQSTSPDGKVRFVGRAASDAQILSTTSVDVPIIHPVAQGDDLIVSLTLTATSPGQVSLTDTAGNSYAKVGDVVDAYWHRTMIFAAFGVKALGTADRVSASYPASSKYHIAVDEFHGINGTSAHAEDSSVYEQNSKAFSTSRHNLTCKPGDLLAAAVATNSGPAPVFTQGWQTLPILKLSSYRLTTSFSFVDAEGKCAASGKTTAQWEATAVVFHR